MCQVVERRHSFPVPPSTVTTTIARVTGRFLLVFEKNLVCVLRRSLRTLKEEGRRATTCSSPPVNLSVYRGDSRSSFLPGRHKYRNSSRPYPRDIDGDGERLGSRFLCLACGSFFSRSSTDRQTNGREDGHPGNPKKETNENCNASPWCCRRRRRRRPWCVRWDFHRSQLGW